MKHTGIIVSFFAAIGLALVALNVRADRLHEGLAAYEVSAFDRARRLLVPEARSGSAVAQYFLGFMAHAGQTGRPDFHEARRWYLQAAAQNHPQALFALGLMYEYGQGVAPDKSRAADYFYRAGRAYLAAGHRLELMACLQAMQRAHPEHPLFRKLYRESRREINAQATASGPPA